MHTTTTWVLILSFGLLTSPLLGQNSNGLKPLRNYKLSRNLAAGQQQTRGGTEPGPQVPRQTNMLLTRVNKNRVAGRNRTPPPPKMSNQEWYLNLKKAARGDISSKPK